MKSIVATDFKFDNKTNRVHIVIDGKDADKYYLMRDIHLPYTVNKDDNDNVVRFKGYLNEEGSDYIATRYDLK